jgi:hypothetical protein
MFDHKLYSPNTEIANAIEENDGMGYGAKVQKEGRV